MDGDLFLFPGQMGVSLSNLFHLDSCGFGASDFFVGFNVDF